MSHPDQRSIFTIVARAVRKSLNDDDLELSESSELTNDLGVDSADYLDIICTLERENHIPSPQNRQVKRSTIAMFRTVGDICEYVERQLGGQQLAHAS